MRYDDWLDAPLDDIADEEALYEWAHWLEIETTGLTASQLSRMRDEYEFREPDYDYSDN